MNESIKITSTANRRIKRVVQLRRQRTRARTGEFIAEGQRQIGRALEAGLGCSELYICPQLLPEHHIETNIKSCISKGSVSCFEVGKTAFVKMAYRCAPEGILGIFAQ